MINKILFLYFCCMLEYQLKFEIIFFCSLHIEKMKKKFFFWWIIFNFYVTFEDCRTNPTVIYTFENFFGHFEQFFPYFVRWWKYFIKFYIIFFSIFRQITVCFIFLFIFVYFLAILRRFYQFFHNFPLFSFKFNGFFHILNCFNVFKVIFASFY